MSWDDPDFTPAPLKPVGNWAEEEEDDLKVEYRDNWDDEDEPSIEEKQPETSEPEKTKPKIKPVTKGATKSKKASASLQSEDSDSRKELTGKELEDLQKQRDLALMGDLFGSESEENVLSFQTEQDAKDFADKIGSRWKSLHGSEHYKTFLSDLFYKLSQDLDAVTVRKLGQELTALGNEIQKTTLNKKAQKAKKAPQIVQKNKGNVMDDVIDDAFAAEGDFVAYDDEEFM